jgi:hypothetical protein
LFVSSVVGCGRYIVGAPLSGVQAINLSGIQQKRGDLDRR